MELFGNNDTGLTPSLLQIKTVRHVPTSRGATNMMWRWEKNVFESNQKPEKP